MASMTVASSKPLIRATASPIPPKPRLQIPQFSTPKFPAPKILPKSQQVFSFSSKPLKSLPLFAATALTYIPPSLEADKEKAELFDFNLTLPIRMAQILALMFALVKFNYSPLRKLKELEERASAEMKTAWKGIAEELSKMLKKIQVEVGERKAAWEKLSAELDEAGEKYEELKADWDNLRSDSAALDNSILRKLKELEELADAEEKAADAEWARLKEEWSKLVELWKKLPSGYAYDAFYIISRGPNFGFFLSICSWFFGCFATFPFLRSLLEICRVYLRATSF